MIFVIFCYQRYKYKTDYSRVNEFGQCEIPTEDMLEEAKQAEHESEQIEQEEKVEKVEEEEKVEKVEKEASPMPKRRRAARDKR